MSKEQEELFKNLYSGQNNQSIELYDTDAEEEEIVDAGGKSVFAETFDFLGKLPAVIQNSPEFFMELPGTLSRAAKGQYINQDTGEVEDVPLQHPDMPEFTETGALEFWDSVGAGLPDVRALLTFDDLEKAKIYEKAFAGKDERWGGIYKDTYSNLMVKWDGEVYYMNKPGMTMQDVQSIIGSVLAFTPASKLARGGGMLARGGKALLGYGGTEAARQAMTKENMNLKEGAGNVGLGAVAEMLLPPVLSGGKRIVQGIAKPAAYFINKAKQLEAIPVWNPPATVEKIRQLFIKPGKSKFSLEKTEGQLMAPGTAKRLELEKEDLLRHSGTFGEENRIKIMDFDEAQINQIRGEVAKIVKEFTDSDRAIIEGAEHELAELIGAKIKEVASNLKKLGTDAYAAAKETGDAFVLAPSIAELSDTLIRSVDELKGGARQLERMPILKENLTYLKKAREMFADPLARNVNYKNLDDWRKRLNIDINSAAKGSPERLALETIKREFDGGINRLITKGLIEGDVEAIQSLQKATNLWRNYKQFSLGQKGDPAFNIMPKILKDENVSANDVLSYIFTANKIKDKGLGLDIINRIKKQGDPELMKLLKEAALIRTFSNPRTGDITRSVIVNNFRENFIKNREIVEKLFTKAEINKLQRFVDEVETTMPAEVWNNTSKSAYSFVNAMAQKKLWPVIRKIPVGVGEFVEAGAEAISGGSAAQRAINPLTYKQIMKNFTSAIPAPLFTSTARTLVEPVGLGDILDPETGEVIGDAPWETSPFKKLLESLSKPAKEKLQTIQ